MAEITRVNNVNFKWPNDIFLNVIFITDETTQYRI